METHSQSLHHNRSLISAFVINFHYASDWNLFLLFQVLGSIIHKLFLD